MSDGSFSFRRFRALTVKEVRQIVRDPSTFLIAFALPMLLLFVFGYAINLDNARAKLGVALLDDSAAAWSLADAYRNSAHFEVILTRSTAPLEAAMQADALRGFVVIPQDFGRGVARNAPPPVQIVTDGAQPNQAAFMSAYAEGVRQNWALARALPIPAYRIISREGPEHEPVFVVSVEVSGREPTQGAGKSKRIAEQQAAGAFLKRERIRT